MKQVRAILSSEATNSASADLVEAAKRIEVASAEFERNSVLGLAMEWSQAVALEGRQSPDDDVEAIRRVTVEDVNRVARRYLLLDESVTAILAPKPSGQPVSPKGFGGAESFTPTEAKSVKLPSWAEPAASRLQVPASRLRPVVTNFPNGLKLIVQRETISDTVSVFGRIKSNPKLQTPRGKEGVDAALDQLFSYGTKSLDRLAYQKALDDVGATESAGTNFSVQVLPENFERAVELLAGIEISPALPGRAFIIVRPQVAAAVAGALESAGHLAERALDAALFPANDPVQREATPDTVNSLSLEDVRDYHRRVFRPDCTTIVVIGNVTPERAETTVAKYFGGWAASGPPPNTTLPPATPNAPSVTRVPDVSRVQASVTLAQTLGLTRTNGDYYALQLGNHVLGGGFYATRLYRDLRENSGLVYYVSSAFDVGQSRGIYRLEYGCDAPNVPKARAIALSNLKDLQTKNVTGRELRQAKVLLLREITLSESSFDRIANGWLSRSILDLPLDEPNRAAHRYLDLSADDVRSAFARWLRPADIVEVTQGPAAE